MVITKEPPPIGMSITDAAAQAGVSPATLYQLAKENRLPGARRIGHRIIIHRAQFEEWLRDGMGQ